MYYTVNALRGTEVSGASSYTRRGSAETAVSSTRNVALTDYRISI